MRLISIVLFSAVSSFSHAADRSSIERLCEAALGGQAFSSEVSRKGQQAYLLLPVSFDRLLTLPSDQAFQGLRLETTAQNTQSNHLIPVPKDAIGKSMTELFLLTSLSKTPIVAKFGGEYIPALGLKLYLKDFAYLIVDLKALDNVPWLLVHFLQLKLNDPKAYQGSSESGELVSYDSLARPEEIGEFFQDMELNFIVHRERRTPVAIVRPGPLAPSLVQGLILPSHMAMALGKKTIDDLRSRLMVHETDFFPGFNVRQ